MQPEAVACIILACLLAACVAALTVLSVERLSGRANRPPQAIVRTYIIHGRHRSDREANVARLTQLAAPITQHGNVTVWPATFTRQDAAVQRQFEACAKQHLRPGEFGCTLSHIAALEHALQSAPEIAAPNTSSWVLIFEDDAKLRSSTGTQRAHAIMQTALATAAAEKIDIVFFGWAYKTKPDAQRRVNAHIWKTSAPLHAHAYAVRGALIPALLITLRQHVCRLPVDVVFQRFLPRTVAIVTPMPYVWLPFGVKNLGLFVQANTTSDTRVRA